MSTWPCLHCGTVNKWPRGFVVVCSHWSVSMWLCYFPARLPALFPLVSVHVALLLSRQNTCPLPIGQCPCGFVTLPPEYLPFSHWSVSMWPCYFPARIPALFPLVSVHVVLLLSRQNSCPLPIGQCPCGLVTFPPE